MDRSGHVMNIKFNRNLPTAYTDCLASSRFSSHGVGARFSPLVLERVDTAFTGWTYGMRLLHSRGALFRTYSHTCSSSWACIARLPLPPRILTRGGREETEAFAWITINRAIEKRNPSLSKVMTVFARHHARRVHRRCVTLAARKGRMWNEL